MTIGNVNSRAIMWFRRDLRIADNPALLAAIAARRPDLGSPPVGGDDDDNDVGGGVMSFNLFDRAAIEAKRPLLESPDAD